MDKEIVKVLCLGDIVGQPGRRIVKHFVPLLRARHQVDLVIANAENAAGGLGPDSNTAQEILAAGVDILTLGDHTWHKKEFRSFLELHNDKCIRPANYSAGAPGRGATRLSLRDGVDIGVLNLIGRVFLNLPLDCPFKVADREISASLNGCKIIIVDLHAEATSEKVAMSKYLDGRVSLLFGTHTHVQTADQSVSQRGTAYITDLGMCGSSQGVIGMHADVAVERFVTGISQSYKIAPGPAMLNGVLVEFCAESGKALKIERIHENLD